MSCQRKLAASIALLILLCGAAWSQQPGGKPAPHIGFAPDHFDFGKVKEGIHVRHTFKVLNCGAAPLAIDRVLTSCGCTVPTMKTKIIAPGQSADLEVDLDTSLKTGKVTKNIEVFSNDPDKPHAIIKVSVNVEDLHRGLKPAEKAKIFLGKCGVCHWQRGLGLEGADLFKADCGMCHGDMGQGAIGPALVPRNYADKEIFNHARQVISYGSKRRITMPAFLTDAGGPLSRQEIDSIMKFLAEASKKH